MLSFVGATPVKLMVTAWLPFADLLWLNVSCNRFADGVPRHIACSSGALSRRGMRMRKTALNVRAFEELLPLDDFECGEAGGAADRALFVRVMSERASPRNVEVAARNQLLRSRGHHAARTFADRLERTLRQSALSPPGEDEEEELEPGGSR